MFKIKPYWLLLTEDKRPKDLGEYMERTNAKIATLQSELQAIKQEINILKGGRK